MVRSEAELKEWADFVADDEKAIHTQVLKQIFTGMMLVPAGSVILSQEDAQSLDSVMTTFRVGLLLEQGFNEHNKLRIAIELARGKNGQG